MQLLPISVPKPKHTPKTASTDTYRDAGVALGVGKGTAAPAPIK